jgi:hypothetical protein
LLGTEVEVLVEGGGDELTVALPGGSSMRLARAWTNADGEPSPSRSQPSTFTVEALRELLELVAALRRRA